MGKSKVILHVYDLSMGLAKSMSSSLIGKQIDGIWHTGVVVYGLEYFYGGGVQRLPPNQVVQNFGLTPVDTIELGETEMEQEDFHQFLETIQSRYTAETYDLFHNNCNNFSHEVAKFLTGSDQIPSYIIDLPGDVLQTPFGQAISPMISQMQQRMQQNMIPFSAPIVGNSTSATISTSNVTTTDAHQKGSSEDEDRKFGLNLKFVSGETGKTMEIFLKGADSSVEELKSEIHKNTGFVPADQRIIFGGKMITAGTMRSNGVEAGQTIHMTPKVGAKANKKPEDAEIELDLESCLRKMEESPEKERRVALKTMLKIIENITKNPHEEKYRRIRKNNPAFAKRMQCVPGAIDSLLALGFVRVDGKEDDEMLELKATEKAWEKLTAGQVKVKRSLDAITRSPSTSSAPNPFAPGLGGANSQQFMNMMNNPMMQTMQQQLLSDPQFVENMAQQAQSMGIPGLDAQSLRQMMQDPNFRQLQQQLMSNPQLMQQLSANMGNIGNLGSLGNLGGFRPNNTTPSPDLSAFIPRRSGNGDSNGDSNEGNGNENGNGDRMSEEEMIQEAIRRSLQEQ